MKSTAICWHPKMTIFFLSATAHLASEKERSFLRLAESRFAGSQNFFQPPDAGDQLPHLLLGDRHGRVHAFHLLGDPEMLFENSRPGGDRVQRYADSVGMVRLAHDAFKVAFQRLNRGEVGVLVARG